LEGIKVERRTGTIGDPIPLDDLEDDYEDDLGEDDDY
jgi:hypothetical protein